MVVGCECYSLDDRIQKKNYCQDFPKLPLFFFFSSITSSPKPSHIDGNGCLEPQWR
jgi:hypothetical protein